MSTSLTTSTLAIAAATDLEASLPETEIMTQENAREGKARVKKGGKAKAAARKRDVYADLHPDQADRLRGLAADMNKLDRAKTKDAFARGRMFETAFEILPAEETFGAWVTQNCECTARTARSYRTLPAELFEYEDRAIASAVPATVLFELAREAVTEDQIEAILASFEAGRRLRVSEVKSRLAGQADTASGADAVDPLDVGGTDGLARLVRACVKSDLAEMRAEIATIILVINDTLAATPADKQVKKAVFMDAVFRHARLAAALLGRAVFSRMEDPIQIGRMTEKRPPASSGWMEAYALLEKLGNKEAYPGVAELRGWLEREVLPMLAWMIAKGKRPKLTLAPTADTSASADAASAAEAATIIEVAPTETSDAMPYAEIEAAAVAAETIVAAPSATKVGTKVVSKAAKAKTAKAKSTRSAARKPKSSDVDDTRGLTPFELKLEKDLNRAFRGFLR